MRKHHTLALPRAPHLDQKNHVVRLPVGKRVDVVFLFVGLLRAVLVKIQVKFGSLSLMLELTGGLLAKEYLPAQLLPPSIGALD